ncbi:MAG: glycosyltransferase [Bacteroidaceae bacterium]|nr:glycosyltransferase [Bacteroidaceae bacterium]
MNYIIVGPAWPFRGGIAAFSERLAYQLIAEGHSVELYTFTLQYPSLLFPGKTQYSSDPAPEGLVIRRRFSSINPFSWLKAAREIRRKQPDVVVFAYWMSFMAPCFGTIAARLGKNVKRLGLIHNMMPHEPNLLDKLFPPYFVRRMDGFITLSGAVADDVRKVLSDSLKSDSLKSKKIAVTPHPLYDHYGELLPKADARHALGLDAEGRYVLFFGLVRAYKGLDLLLEALADPLLHVADVRLVVAGEFYDDEQPYRDKIQALGLSERIVLHNRFIPNDQVNRYFSAADIVCQPYRSATQSGVTQIAYHFCKPMLVTDVGGLAEIIPHAPVGTEPPAGAVGYVVPPAPAAIADALVDFYAHYREPSFTAAAAEEKKKYAWTNLTQALYGLL